MEQLGDINIPDMLDEANELSKTLPKKKFKLSDDEFKLMLKTIDGVRMPISMLDDVLPYKIKRDKNGKFIGLPGGLDERAKGLGIKLSRFTYEQPETNELFIEIICNEMTDKEVSEFIKMRDARLNRYFNKTSDDIIRVTCNVCKTRVQVGKISGDLKVYCACDESPIDAVDITDLLDIARIKNWK